MTQSDDKLFQQLVQAGMETTRPSEDLRRRVLAAALSVQQKVAELGDDAVIPQDSTQPSVRPVPDVPTEQADGVPRGPHPIKQPPRRRHMRWRFVAMFQKRAVRWSTAAAVVIVFMGLASWLIPGGSKNGLVFADVQKQLSVFRPYTCLFTIQQGNKPDSTYRQMKLSLSRRREIRSDGRIIVFDMSQKPVKILTLDPAKKLAIENTYPNEGPRSDPDLLNLVTNVRYRTDGGVEDLGRKEIEGRLAHGFHASDKANDFTIWVDPNTSLPIRFEIIHVQHNRRIIMSDFKFDVDFDEALFSTTAPEGYTVKREENKIRTALISAQEIAQRATFKTYVLAADPSWARMVQIVETTDPVKPGHWMYLFAAVANDGRHLVMAQSQAFNEMLGPKVKGGQLVYTSPNGFRVWAGGPDKWYSQILLNSAQDLIPDEPSEERVGYVLESPAGTFPILAINGPVSDAELHSIVDNLVPAEEYKSK